MLFSKMKYVRRNMEICVNLSFLRLNIFAEFICSYYAQTIMSSLYWCNMCIENQFFQNQVILCLQTLSLMTCWAMVQYYIVLHIPFDDIDSELLSAVLSKWQVNILGLYRTRGIFTHAMQLYVMTYMCMNAKYQWFFAFPNML